MLNRLNQKYALFAVLKVLVLLGAFYTGTVYAETKSPAPSVLVDPENNAIRFIIDGKEMAVIDGQGMHIYGNFSYNGTMTDGTPLHLMKDREADE